MTNTPVDFKTISQKTLKSIRNLFIFIPLFFTVTIMSTLLLTISISYASFEDVGMGARATGMSNAFTAVADDAYAVYYNPAGLNNLVYPEFASTYGKMMMGLDDGSNMGNSFMVYSHPLKNDTNERVGNIAIAWQEFRLNGLYRENVLYISYARKFFEELSFGVNFKNLRREFGTDDYTENAIDQYGTSLGSHDPVFDGGKSKRAFSLDLGFQYALGFNKNYVLGLSILNINQPDLGLKTTDKIPMNTKIGFQYKNKIANFSMDVARKKVLKSAVDTIISVGGERWFTLGTYGNVAARGGFGVGSRAYRSLSIGASYRIHAVQFDYGMVLPLTGIEDTMGSHRVSLSFRFGDMDPEDDIGKLLLEEEELYQAAKQALEEVRRELEIARKEAELAEQEVDFARKNLHLGRSKKAFKRAEKAEKKAQNIYERASKIAYKFYKKRVAGTMGLKGQQIVLEKIIKKYEKTGISVEQFQDELNDISIKLEENENEYRMEFNYYKKMRRSGASIDDKRTIINRIINKYRGLGINVKECINELEKL